VKEGVKEACTMHRGIHNLAYTHAHTRKHAPLSATQGSTNDTPLEAFVIASSRPSPTVAHVSFSNEFSNTKKVRPSESVSAGQTACCAKELSHRCGHIGVALSSVCWLPECAVVVARKRRINVLFIPVKK